MPRLLFCLKHRDMPWGHYGYHLSSGLRNSVCFLVEMLKLLGIIAEVVELIDNNFIDAAVTKFRPTHCIVEAFWVTPAKFAQLKKRHPLVTFMVRDHSETPFLANEGRTMEWIAAYLKEGVEITANSPRAMHDLNVYATALGYPGMVSYSPNYYPVHQPPNWRHLRPHPVRADDTVRVGCFGAIRPLKNHLVQATAALQYAASLGKKLEFYINASRIEGGGNPILANLIAMFAATPRAKLVQIGWLEHAAFLDLLFGIDICLQVSFSETFNIVSADAVASSCPVVASREVIWLKNYAIAEPTSTASIVRRMQQVHQQNLSERLAWQWRDLAAYTENTKRVWLSRFA
jgi:glycosyltransferase involved in cell wall biosynthesis